MSACPTIQFQDTENTCNHLGSMNMCFPYLRSKAAMAFFVAKSTYPNDYAFLQHVKTPPDEWAH